MQFPNNRSSLRVLRALGNKRSKKVTATMGPEQEYFLIDKEWFDQRLDLIMTGRTLFGAPSPKGQELEDQYFGAIKDRISKFMRDLDIELWKMGIPSKTKHNEVAPAQYEMAPMFETINVATDHNQLVMETLQKVALRHGLVCLLYEKPFAGVNGSGKHNNWSMATDDGENLLNPGKTPHENEQFLVFLSALIMAVDKHALQLRAAASNPGNDLRLGANEAPPAIISIFMGSELTEILEALAAGKPATGKGQNFLNLGVDHLPPLPMDNTDRNRTSPFAFTGNKFEFRMVASSASIAGPNVVLNTAAAEALDEIATRLEKAKDVNKEAAQIVKDIMKKHGRVIYNGNGYTDEWVAEAKKRGLPNVKSWIEALESLNTPEAHKMFEKYKVLSKRELESRYEVYIEMYAKHINIEAKAAIQMAKTLYIPAVVAYTAELAETIGLLKSAGANSTTQANLLKKTQALLDSAAEKTEALEKAREAAEGQSNSEHRAAAFRDKVFTAQASLREDIDALEQILPKDAWPVPSYADMLFGF
jgi:glutamine synthetase